MYHDVRAWGVGTTVSKMRKVEEVIYAPRSGNLSNSSVISNHLLQKRKVGKNGQLVAHKLAEHHKQQRIDI